MFFAMPSHSIETACLFRFKAEEHLDEIRAFFAQGSQKHRCLTTLDVFGASGKMAARWAERNFRAASFDIKRHSEDDDITTKHGWFRLANLGLMLLPGAFLFASPPCRHSAALPILIPC